MINQTQQLTDLTLNADDRTSNSPISPASGLGLGGSTPIVNLNNNESKESFFKKPPVGQPTPKQLEELPKISSDKEDKDNNKDNDKESIDNQKPFESLDHGEIQSKITNLESDISKYQSFIDSPNLSTKMFDGKMRAFLEKEGLINDYEALVLASPDINYFSSKMKSLILEKIRNEIPSHLKEKEQLLHDLKKHPNYESRSMDQQREDTIREELQELEDTKYQREAKDISAAGLNKALMFGSGGSGGGVASSQSRGESEEERRRKKRKEDEERRLAREREERAQMQQMISLIMGIAGAGSMSGLGLKR